MPEFFPGQRHENATEVSADIRDRLVHAAPGETILDDFRMRAKANAWTAAPRTVQTSAEFLMRNIVVAENNIGHKRTTEAVGTTYGEVIQMACDAAGQPYPQADPEAAPSMTELQAGYNNGSYEVVEASDPAGRAQLIDGLMFANQQLLIGSERDAITAQTDQSYYLNNIAAAYMNLVRE